MRKRTERMKRADWRRDEKGKKKRKKKEKRREEEGRGRKETDIWSEQGAGREKK